MILGIGNDIIDIRRIEKTLERYGERFPRAEAVVAISSDIGRLALEASAVYGKAVGHAADLNFGDCFAYACAKSLGVGLLYKGNDFAHTDLA